MKSINKLSVLENVEKNDAAVRTVVTQNVSSGWKTRVAGSSAWAVGVAGYSYYNIK